MGYTNDEQLINEKLAEVMRLFRGISTGGCCHDDDMREIELHVHALQAELTQHAASRLVEFDRRPIGGCPPGTCDHG